MARSHTPSPCTVPPCRQRHPDGDRQLVEQMARHFMLPSAWLQQAGALDGAVPGGGGHGGSRDSSIGGSGPGGQGPGRAWGSAGEGERGYVRGPHGAAWTAGRSWVGAQPHAAEEVGAGAGGETSAKAGAGAGPGESGDPHGPGKDAKAQEDYLSWIYLTQVGAPACCHDLLLLFSSLQDGALCSWPAHQSFFFPPGALVLLIKLSQLEPCAPDLL